MLSSLPTVCDRVVEGGLILLVLFSPLAFGTVHPASLALAEICAFALLLAFALRLWAGAGDNVPILPVRIWLPMAALLALVALQWLPLPPALLRTLSPSSYELNATASPGWPERAPYAEALAVLLRADSLVAERAGESPAPVVRLPTEREVERFGIERFIPPDWERGPAALALDESERAGLTRWLEVGGGRAAWRPLSLAPESTRSAFVKLLACLSLFLVATGAGGADRRDRRRFERRLLRALVFAVSAIAVLALFQRFTWNGKILWFFIPWDWGAARPEVAQTSGPFVNRNHFAAYLGLLLPLVLTPVLVRTGLDLRAGRRVTRLVFGAAAATLAIALLWSLSRGGWLSSLVGVAVLIALLSSRAERLALPRLLRDWRVALAAAAASAAVLLALVLVPVGGSGAGVPANDIDLRLQSTLESTASLERRIASWRDSLPMLADHPGLGVGLGAWGAAFPHYDASARLRARAHRAHNDYLQLACETGVVGVLLVGLWAFFVARLLALTLAQGSRDALPISAAVVAGTAALGLHELVDFGLQIPAIAFSAAVLLGLALRESWPRRVVSRSRALGLASTAGLAAVLGLVVTFASADREGPSDAEAGLLDLLQQTRRLPISTEPRLALARRVLELSPAAARDILESAVALDPGAPGPRDALAAALVRLGEQALALAQVEESVARAPWRLAHPYLASDLARWLSPAELSAIERGFARALPGSGAQSAAELASFRRDRGDFVGAAKAWQQAARRAASNEIRTTYLRFSGQDLARSGQPDAARVALERAIALNPDAPDAYADLMARVLGPQRELAGAEALAGRALAAGADAYEIELALAEASRSAGSIEQERRALERAVASRPGDARGPFRLGLSHHRADEWGPAAESLARAVRLDPTLAAAWYYLGLAEERQYRFAEARGAFEAAAREDPDNEHYRRNLARFLARIEENRK